MTDRPKISAVLLASINESAASRLLRKLDKQPAIAESWAWTSQGGTWNIDTGSESVKIENALVNELQDVQCSCLLAPKCFHVLAVSNVLLIDDSVPDTLKAEPTSSASDRSSSTNSKPSTTDSEELAAETDLALLTTDHVQAANMMHLAVAEIIQGGLRATGGSIQSKLLRALHECRATGLHRLAAAGLRILNHARLLRMSSEEFLPAQAVQSLHEALLVAHQITTAESTVSRLWVGTARRRYQPVASLKLFGLCCEPVLTASGYSGVITWMLNQQGDVVSISDVQPGTANRIAQAWKSNVTLAGLALSHADLSKQKLLISKATISDDGRVGGSDSAKAVPSKHQGWNNEVISKRFAEPLDEQIQRYFDQIDAVGTVSKEGAALMFFTGIVYGYEDADLILQLQDETIARLTIASDTKDLPYRANLTMLARAPGLPIRCIGRLLPLQPGCFQLLSIGNVSSTEQQSDQKTERSNDDVPQLKITDGSHVDLGLENLQRSQFSTAQKHPVNSEDVGNLQHPRSDSNMADAEGILADWLKAIAAGGRHALSRSAIKRLIKDTRHLEANFQPTASQALKTLAQQAIDTQTTFEGLRFPSDSTQLADAWLAAAIVQLTTFQCLQRAEWRATLRRSQT